jgi:zinc protease
MRRYGLPADWITGQPDRLRASTEASVQAAWARRIQPEKLAIVIVGDVATIRPQLEALQIPIVLVNDDGRPVEKP